jgi:NAD(P)H dehydrogenase (quinone)
MKERSNNMAQVLIVYYSRSGNTAKMAELVAEGVRESGAGVAVKKVEETNVGELLKADGIIMGSPTYYGTMAAEIKAFIDKSVKYHGKLVGKVGGAFASSGGLAGGNETTVLDIVKALLIHGMIIPGNVEGDHYGAAAVGAPDKRSAEQCRIIGKLVGDLAQRLKG